VPRRGRNGGIISFPLLLGVVSLAFLPFLYGCELGATLFCQRCGVGLEKKNEE